MHVCEKNNNIVGDRGTILVMLVFVAIIVPGESSLQRGADHLCRRVGSHIKAIDGWDTPIT